MLLHKPRRRVRNRQTEFFIEFARERLMNGFTLFKLAAREFPVTRIGLAFGAGTQQHPAVFTNKHADGHFNNVVAHRKSPIVRARFPRTQLVNCPPSRRFMLGCRTGSLSRSRLSQRKSVDSDIFFKGSPYQPLHRHSVFAGSQGRQQRTEVHRSDCPSCSRSEDLPQHER